MTSPRSRRRRARGRPPSDPRVRSVRRPRRAARRRAGAPGTCPRRATSPRCQRSPATTGSDGNHALYTASLAQKRMRSQCRSGSARRQRAKPRPLLVPQDEVARRLRERGVRLGVDPDAAQPLRSRHDRGPVPGTVGHAADHPGGPLRHSDRRRGVSASEAARSAAAPGGRNNAPRRTRGDARYRVRDHGGLDREHRRLRNVGVHVGACRRSGPTSRSSLRVRAKSESVWVEVGASHLRDDGSPLRPTLIQLEPRGLCVRTPALILGEEPIGVPRWLCRGRRENVNPAADADPLDRRRRHVTVPSYALAMNWSPRSSVHLLGVPTSATWPQRLLGTRPRRRYPSGVAFHRPQRERLRVAPGWLM